MHSLGFTRYGLLPIILIIYSGKMFYSLIFKFIKFFSKFVPDKDVAEEFINKDEAHREPTRDFYEDLGRSY